jgi:hypothetical protein
MECLSSYILSYNVDDSRDGGHVFFSDAETAGESARYIL